MRNFSFLVLIITLGLFVSPLQSQQKLPHGPTEAEFFALLPPYCHARLKGDDQTKNLWSQRMGGDNFLHVHHYCFGLDNMNKAMVFGFDKKKRDGYLNTAINEFNYVLRAWPANFRLNLEAQNYKMQAEMLLKQH